jgi:hypothetical protein
MIARLAVILACVVTGAAAQERLAVVQGVVRDTVTGVPIPFAVVNVTETGQSTLSNRDGRFYIELPSGGWELEVRKIGFRMSARQVVVGAVAVEVDLYLRRIPLELADIRVIAEADDPATRIIREAIARKNDALARVHDYRYEAYIKMVLRDLAKPVDSSESIVLISETETAAYWEQPDKYQEVIKARRQSRNLPAENNLVSVGQIVNFNRDRIDLQKYSVVSPVADDALEHYRYRMLDTLAIDGRRIFRLAIEPRFEAQPLFVGMIDIVDSTYAVWSIDVGANTAVEFDLFHNLRYRQRLREVQDSLWMPYEIGFSGEVRFGVPIPGIPRAIGFSHSAMLDEYRFDTGDPPPHLSEYAIVVDEGVDEADSTEWQARRAQPLTDLEDEAYARIDSVERAPPSLTERLATGLVAAVFIANNPDVFHFNRVESAYFGLGYTFRDLSPDWVLRGKGGYAIGPEQWQYDFAVQHRLIESQRLWLGAAIRDEVVARPIVLSAGRNSTFVSLFTKVDPLDYYRERGVSGWVSTRLFPFTQLRVQYNDFRQTSMPVTTAYSVFDTERIQRLNHPIADGRLRSFSASLTYDSRPLLKRQGRDFYLNTLTSTRVTLGAEVAAPEVIANDFEFERVYARLQRVQRTLNLGLTTIEVFLGAGFGALPPQRYFTVDFGDAGLIYNTGKFNTAEENNFAGNRIALVVVDHDFDGQLFRRTGIPGVRDLPITINVHAGVFFTDFVDHPTQPGDDLVNTAPTGYWEVGFGVGDLTPFLAPFNLSAYFTWQLSDYPTDRFKFSFGIPAPF